MFYTLNVKLTNFLKKIEEKKKKEMVVAIVISLITAY